MKITQIRVYQVDLPLSEPYWLSVGRLKAVVHWALSTPTEFDRATWDCSQHHSVVTATGGYTKVNGRATVSDDPSLGIEPVMDTLGDPAAIYS